MTKRLVSESKLASRAAKAVEPAATAPDQAFTEEPEQASAEAERSTPDSSVEQATDTMMDSEPTVAGSGEATGDAGQAAQLLEAPLVADGAVPPNGLTSEDQAKILELAKLGKVEYDRSRKAAASELKLSQPVLDELVDEQRVKDTEESTLANPEPWPDPVDGDGLLTELFDTYQKHVIASDEARIANVLWILGAHTHDCWSHSPILQITAPTPDAGKTTALKFNMMLVPKPLAASNVTPAAVFRVIAKLRPTLLIDEADASLPEKPDLRSILDSGHDRAAAFVFRCVGDDFEPKQFST